MEFDVESREGYILVTTRGVADVKGLGDALDAIFRHEDWRPGHSYVFDHSALNAAHLSGSDIQQIADRARTRREKHGVRSSASVAPDAVVYGICRMWSAYVADDSHVATDVFRTMEEAVAWVSAKR